MEAVEALENAPPLDKRQWEEIAGRLPVPAEPLCTMCGYCQGCPAGIQVSRLMGAYILERPESTVHIWELK